MSWLTNAPSAAWQWVGLVAGLLGLALAIVAIPTAFQMFFGRAKPSVEFSSNRNATFVSLQCYVKNAPISNRILKLLGVSRQSSTVMIALRIQEQGTGKLVCSDMLNMSNGVGGDASETPQLTTVWPLVAAPIVWLRSEDSARINGQKRKEAIARGIYAVEVKVRTEHGLEVIATKHAHVGANADELYWSA